MQSTISKDLKNFGFMYFILCISMMPLIAYGYSMYALILLFPWIFKCKFSINSLNVILFSFFYVTSFFLRGEELPISKFVFYLLFPIIIYSCGNILGMNLKKGKTIVVVLFSLALCLAIPGIYFSIEDTIQSGNLINVSRAVSYKGEHILSATAYGMMFSLLIAGIGMLFLLVKNEFDKRLKIFIIAGSIFALFSTIHIVNRTGLALGLISIITVLCIQPFTYSRLIYILLTCIILYILSIYMQDSVFMNDALQGYLSRELDDDYSIGTGGDRFNRWGGAFFQIITNPAGGPGYNMDGRISYAHNLWLDAGLRGGILPFIMIFIIALQIAKYTYLVLKRSNLDFFLKAYITVLCLVMFAQAMVEPVIEGVYQFFLFMIFFYGCLTSLRKRIRYGAEFEN